MFDFSIKTTDPSTHAVLRSKTPYIRHHHHELKVRGGVKSDRNGHKYTGDRLSEFGLSYGVIF